MNCSKQEQTPTEKTSLAELTDWNGNLDGYYATDEYCEQQIRENTVFHDFRNKLYAFDDENRKYDSLVRLHSTTMNLAELSLLLEQLDSIETEFMIFGVESIMYDMLRECGGHCEADIFPILYNRSIDATNFWKRTENQQRLYSCINSYLSVLEQIQMKYGLVKFNIANSAQIGYLLHDKAIHKTFLHQTLLNCMNMLADIHNDMASVKFDYINQVITQK